MRKVVLNLWVCLLVVFISCGGDEDEGPDFEFIDQVAAGKIDGESWTYADGQAEIQDFGGGNIDLFVNLFLAQTETGCDVFISDGDEVFFSLPNEVGLYKLSWGSAESHTVTLYDEEEALNVILIKGAVEILSISASEISGRIDARADDDNYVNGNFTVAICQ